MRRAKGKRGRVRAVVGRVAQRGGRALGQRRDLARKAVVGALLPLAMMAGQGLLARLDRLPSCEARQASGSFFPAGERGREPISRSALSLTLASGVVVGGQAVLVTFSACGRTEGGAVVEAMALGIQLIGGLGSFAATLSWRHAE